MSDVAAMWLLIGIGVLCLSVRLILEAVWGEDVDDETNGRVDRDKEDE